MTPDVCAAIERLKEMDKLATPRPIRVSPEGPFEIIGTKGNGKFVLAGLNSNFRELAEANGQLLCASRNVLPCLIEAVEAADEFSQRIAQVKCGEFPEAGLFLRSDEARSFEKRFRASLEKLAAEKKGADDAREKE